MSIMLDRDDSLVTKRKRSPHRVLRMHALFGRVNNLMLLYDGWSLLREVLV